MCLPPLPRPRVRAWFRCKRRPLRVLSRLRCGETPPTLASKWAVSASTRVYTPCLAPVLRLTVLLTSWPANASPCGGTQSASHFRQRFAVTRYVQSPRSLYTTNCTASSKNVGNMLPSQRKRRRSLRIAKPANDTMIQKARDVRDRATI